MDWFIGDTHFGHKNILAFMPEARPFDSVEEMNETLIENWNKVVKDDDRVFHLGDVSFGGQYDVLRRLKGRRIIVVLGNHDYHTKVVEILKDERYRVCGCMEYKGCILTHIPVHPSQFGRYKANIHGHLHVHNLDDPRYINVSCEQNYLYPLDWDTLKNRLPKKEE